MKKIFTLLFFVGFLTSAFAQQDRHQQYGTQPNDNGSQPAKHYDNNYAYSKSYPANNDYNKNDQWNNGNHQNDYGHNKDWDHRDRDDVRRDQYAHSQYGNHEYEDHSYKTRRRVPLFRVLFGVGGLF